MLQKDSSFQIEDTLATKGVAILLLLFYHLFFNPTDLTKYHVKAFLLSNSNLSNIASLGNVCVTLFIFLAGYGMANSLNDEIMSSFKSVVLCLIKRFLKFYLSFWFIFVLFVPFQPLFNYFPYHHWLEFIGDFFGLSLFTGVYINESWWFLGILFICYALSPLLVYLYNKIPVLTLALSVLVSLNANYYIVLVCSFSIAIFFKKYSILDRFKQMIVGMPGSRIYGLLASMVFLCSAILMAYKNQMTFYYILLSLFMMPIVMFVSLNKTIKRCLVLLGIHSSNVYYFHTFLYYYDFPTWVYRPRYFLLIFASFSLICFGISWGIETLKKWLHYHGIYKSITGMKAFHER